MATKIQIKAATPGFPRQLKWNDYKWVDQSPIPPFEALTGSSYKVTQWGYTLGTAPNDRRGSYFGTKQPSAAGARAGPFRHYRFDRSRLRDARVGLASVRSGNV